MMGLLTMKPRVTWRMPNEYSSFVESIPEVASAGASGSRSDTLFLYFDESGNLDFKQSGTPYFIMTCVAARRPFLASRQLSELRYDLMEQGLDIEKFHACEDQDQVRTKVYSILSNTNNGYRVYSAHVEKAFVPEEYRTPEAIYAKVFELIFDEVYEKEAAPGLVRVIAVTDKLPKDAQRRNVAGPLKRYMKRKFQKNNVPYKLLHHNSASDMNLQATDYYCWAAQRDLVQGRSWPMTKVYESFVEVGVVSFG